MKTSSLLRILLLAWTAPGIASSVHAQTEAASPGRAEVLTTVEQIRKLTREEANSDRAVRLRGVVTFAHSQWGNLFFQDTTGGIGSWPWLEGCTARAGDWIEFEGTTEQSGFGPALRPSRIQVLGKGSFPAPLTHSLSYLLTGRDDAQWVEMAGVVRRVTTQNLHIMSEGGEFIAWIEDLEGARPESLIDAAVRIQGVCMPKWNDRNQIVAIRLLCPSQQHLEVLKPAPENPFQISTSAIHDLLHFRPEGTAPNLDFHRVKIAGVVSGQVESMLYIQDGTNGARVETAGPFSAQPGDRMEVVGFVQTLGLSPLLTESLLKRIGRAAPPDPIAADVQTIFSGELDAKRVCIQGKVMESVVQSRSQMIQLQISNRVVRAFLPNRETISVPVGSTVQVTGVCSIAGNRGASIFEGLSLVDLHLSSMKDLIVIRRGPWWTLKHAAGMIGILAGATMGTLGWVRTLRRKVEIQTRELKHEIAERIRIEDEMAKTHKVLLEASHQAGMAEVATSVLHNVGNVLNSVNVSCQVILEQMAACDAVQLEKVAGLLETHSQDPSFFRNEGKGALLPQYLRKLAKKRAGDRASLLKEVHVLNENINHIRSIISMQQNYATVAGVTEKVDVHDLVEDALRLSGGEFEQDSILLVRDFAEVPEIEVEKHKLLQILVNLIRNARDACAESGIDRKIVRLRIALAGPGRLQIQVIDNGVGICAENLTKIFSYGFTTRQNGHGFGLHSGALAAKQMGGTLLAESDGLGLGARFTLELPGLPA